MLAVVRRHAAVAASLRSVRLASRVGLGAEVSGGRAGLGEVAREDWLEEGAEDDLGATRRSQMEMMLERIGPRRTQSGEGPSRGPGRT
jgi:hypothetical protein